MNVNPATIDTQSISNYTNVAKHHDIVSFFMDIIPSSIIDAFAKGNILQIILFSVLFGSGTGAASEPGAGDC